MRSESSSQYIGAHAPDRSPTPYYRREYDSLSCDQDPPGELEEAKR